MGKISTYLIPVTEFWRHITFSVGCPIQRFKGPGFFRSSFSAQFTAVEEPNKSKNGGSEIYRATKNVEERVLEGHNVVITRQAGNGKTALMKEIHFDLTFIGMQCLFQCIFNVRVLY